MEAALQGSCLAADIGNIFVRAKSSEEFCSAVRGLTITQKFELYMVHFIQIRTPPVKIEPTGLDKCASMIGARLNRLDSQS